MTRQHEAALDSSGEGRQRVMIESVEPQIDCGDFPIKRTRGETVVVEADVFADGHDVIDCRLVFRPVPDGASGTEDPWQESPMAPVGGDRWRGNFRVDRLGQYEYGVVAWIDRFASWRRDLKKRFDAGQEVDTELEIGDALIREAVDHAVQDDAAWLAGRADKLKDRAHDVGERVALALDGELSGYMQKASPRRFATRTGRPLRVIVDPERARFSAWYELFPRSCSGDPQRHGTFGDIMRHLPYIGEMGFDVLYLPPIHPIGHTHRKGRNNAPVAQPDDIGSPWAIGNAQGGHKSIHPSLGTDADFRELVQAAARQGLAIALDIAFQCSPDHPYVAQHPEWFRHRPDGTIRHAENPPKKYEDIFPFDFESEAWPSLWHELKSIFEHWIGQGVTTFRVDNPHTKSLAFWQWCIGELKRDHPELIFLSEAFTRPRLMRRLAKLGFTQSYTYFAWKNTKHELEAYFTELTRTPTSEYLRPNVWPNTPDILNEYLQHGGRSAFMARVALAGTLSANYGIYGPAFELAEHLAHQPGSEEYLDSEKYQLRHWDLDHPDSLAPFIARINHIRRDNPALHGNDSLHFHRIDNDLLIAYSKHTPDLENIVLVVVNLDPRHVQSGWITLDLGRFGLDEGTTYAVHDLVTNAHHVWHGQRNFVQLDPHASPAHILRIRRRVRTEQDFEYFL